MSSEVDFIVRGPATKLWDYLENPQEMPSEIAMWGCAGSGKSYQILAWLFLGVCHRWPKIPGRILICRDTYNSLTRSACVTVRKLLPPGHPALDGPTDEHRTEYRVGAWTITLSGLSEPSRLYSTEWDIVFVEEGREIGLSTWEEFSRGSRNYALYRYSENGELVRDINGNYLRPGLKSAMDHPFALTILATNPDSKSHWIYKRGTAGKMAFWQAHFQDNPAYWNAEKNCANPMGLVFSKRMSNTSGTRYRRLWLAEWCSTEGAVWPEFDPDIHILRDVKRDEDGWVLPSEVHRLGITEFYAGVDFGFDNSGVMLVGGYTKDRKLVIVAEVFHSRQGVEWWRDWVVKIHKRFPISIGWCDHNRPDWITAWNDSIGVPKDGPGAVFVKADKGVDRGLEIVRRRLNRSDPSVHFVHDALLHAPDPELLDRHVAWRTIDCIPEYVYKRASYSDDQADDTGARPDKPDKSKATSDGADALRYLCVGLEYFEPEDSLAIPLNANYRAKMLFGRKVRGDDDELANEAEMSEIDVQDWIVDTIRAAANNGYEN